MEADPLIKKIPKGKNRHPRESKKSRGILWMQSATSCMHVEAPDTEC